MELRRSTILDRGEWNGALGALPGPHVLQTWEWGEVKAGYGWTAERLLWRTVDGRPVAAAQVLERRMRVPVLGFSSSVLYAPRGPVLDWRQAELADHVLSDLRSMAGRPGVLQLKIDPDLPVGYGQPGSAESGEDPTGTALGARLPSLGFRPSPE